MKRRDMVAELEALESHQRMLEFYEKQDSSRREADIKKLSKIMYSRKKKRKRLLSIGKPILVKGDKSEQK